jgi:hypothetical protein
MIRHAKSKEKYKESYQSVTSRKKGAVDTRNLEPVNSSPLRGGVIKSRYVKV